MTAFATVGLSGLPELGTKTMPTEFGAWLRAERKRRGKTIYDLAAGAGVSHVAVSDWERGKRNPRRENVEMVASALTGENALPEDAARFLAEALQMAGFASKDLPEIERIVSDEEWELLQAYRGVEPRMQRSFKDLLVSAVEVTGDEPKEELVFGRGPHKPQK